jgi:tetratricopeptide (TPR) repeat protein
MDLAILCLEHQQENRSVIAATAGIAKIPKASSLFLIRGVAYAQLAAYDKAENDFAVAAQLNPNRPNSTIAMSLLYSDGNQLDKEKALLQEQLKLTPDDAVTNYLLISSSRMAQNRETKLLAKRKRIWRDHWSRSPIRLRRRF